VRYNLVALLQRELFTGAELLQQPEHMAAAVHLAAGRLSGCAGALVSSGTVSVLSVPALLLNTSACYQVADRYVDLLLEQHGHAA
jgi:hypothetical protein